MKLLWFVAVASCLSSLPSDTAAAPPADEPSNLSEFRGRYSGRISYAGFANGKTDATIVARRTQESGKIALTSVLNALGMTAELRETIRIRGHQATYSISIAGTSSPAGSGTVNVSRNIIRYNARFSQGGIDYVLQGTIRKHGNQLRIVATIYGGPTPIPIRYVLTEEED